jgi:glycolate oxidase FAD binding subunit
MDSALEGICAKVKESLGAARHLRPRGGGTKDFYGGMLQGEVLDTRGYAGIVAYEPSELVITARCGTGLADIEAAMNARGQMLAFEPPHFGPGATLGGMVASGLSGPRRPAAGSLRDFVLGVKMIDGRGEILSFGGQVMKNVAGYDVSRLMAGSLGTLGVIVEVSLKALPRPDAETTLRFELPEDRAIETLNKWAGKPLPISASAWTDGELLVRLSGAAAAIESARGKMGGEREEGAQAGRVWEELREHSGPFFRGPVGMATPLWRISVASAAPPLGVPGAQMIEWGGALRWLVSNADARTVREAAKRAGGHATLFRAEDKSAGVFQPLAPALMDLHRRLKRELDPQGLFSRGRMYPDF